MENLLSSHFPYVKKTCGHYIDYTIFIKERKRPVRIVKNGEAVAGKGTNPRKICVAF
ncbi:hypothetical protein HMPREF3033_00664 [Veillonellaceae bacterium DNF00751]|nr:hypothetical protein HMPREF3033_00664 [Veillonellaceae bacterium DNF00751]